MALLPPNQLLHLGPDPSSTVGWNHFDLGQGLSSHINYPQSQLGNSPPQGAPWWYSKTNSAGIPVAVFSAPLGGATTSTNTEYARDELREYERDGTTKMAFNPNDGDHWIEGIYRIYGLSGLQKPGDCVQQAHDSKDDVIMVRTELVGGATKLQLRYNGTLVATLNSSYVDGTEFYLKTRVNNGTPEVYYTTNVTSPPSTPTHTSSGYFSGATTGWYFKTGSYNQTNEITDPNVDPDASIIRVEVRELKHWHSKTPMGGAWPTPATYAASSSTATVNAGADASISSTGTFSRTASITLNGSTLTSQEWKILSGPVGAGTVLSTGASVSWTPSAGGGQALGVGGIAKPSGAVTGQGSAGTWSITSGGTAANPLVYDGEGRTVGRVNITADYVVVQNYNIVANSQYGAYIEANNVTFQNNDVKGLTPTGDGDLNVITMFGNNIKIRYNTAINPVSGDPGASHTDAIQTWVSSSHPNASQNCQVIGNKFTGPANPSRLNSIGSLHQCIMVESAGHGGNTGGTGTPSDWLVLDNEFGDSWNQCIKLDAGNNFTFARNNFSGSSDVIFALTGTGNTVYTSNTFGSGYGSVGASTTSGTGPTDPVVNAYPNGNYVLQFTAVTSSGTAVDTVNVAIAAAGAVSVYPSFVSVGAAAQSDGSGTVTVPAPAGVTSGHFQICVIQDATEEGITAVPANWALLDEQGVDNVDVTGAPAGPSHAFIYYNTTGDSQSRSWTKDGTRGYHAVRLAWKDFSSLGQHFSRGSSYTTTPYSPVVDPVTTSALVVAVLGSDRKDVSPGPVSVPNGWTQRYNQGVTLTSGEVEWISVADIQVANGAAVGGNVPTNSGITTSNFSLTNPDNCSLFSFVIEGIVGTGTTAVGSVQLTVNKTLIAGAPPLGGGGVVALSANATLTTRAIAKGLINLTATVSLSVLSETLPRGILIALPRLTFATFQLQVSQVNLQVIPVLRAGALPYRRPVLRTDYVYPPRNHPFRLIAQRILDGEIIEWDLPVDHDFEYVEQLSGPVVMKGAFRPEIISVQELNLDGYAYWLHVEINEQIRASAILLPPQYEESSLSFSAEGVAAAPHYHIYDGVFQQIQIDPLSIVRTIWNYVQSQSQSDYGVVVSPTSSPVRLGEPFIPAVPDMEDKIAAARWILDRVNEGVDWASGNPDGWPVATFPNTPDTVRRWSNTLLAQAVKEITPPHNQQSYALWLSNFIKNNAELARDKDAKPYELVWWNATNCGEEIDTLSGQTPFDYIERHEWNSDRTDVLHYVDLGYPRIGKPLPNLLFNEENILEVVPMQEGEDTYASAVLIIGAGEGVDTIRGYAAQSFGDRVRKEIVITDKTITTVERANSRALTELAIRRGRTFEISEIVINAYHPNAPIGTYHVGDDISVSVDIPWLMETHAAWYRITSIGNKPSSDKVRIGLSHAGAFDYSETIVVTPSSGDDYVPFEPPVSGATTFPGNVSLSITANLNTSGTLITPLDGVVSLTAPTTLIIDGFVFRSGAVSMTVGKVLTVIGIATGPLASTVTLISNKTLTVNAAIGQPTAVSLSSTSTLAIGGIGVRLAAVSLAAIPTLSVSATGLPIGGFGSTPFGAAPFGADAAVGSGFGSTSFGIDPFGSNVIGDPTASGVVTLTVVKTLTVGGAVVPGIVQLGKTTNGTATSLSSGNKVTVSRHTASSNGFVIAGHAQLWVDTGTASVEMVVYADSAGAPGALLGLSNTVVISNITEAQIDFTFSGAQQASITNGTAYWIGFTWADPGTNSVNWSRDSVLGSAQQSNTHTPNPFGTPISVSGPIDAYVDVTSS